MQKIFKMVAMQGFVKIFICVGLIWVFYALFHESQDSKQMKQLIQTHLPESSFKDGFEHEEGFLDLFPQNFSRWHEISLKNKKYCLIRPASCEAQNQITLEKNVVQEGQKSLRFHPKSQTNASIRKQGLAFKKGDNVYFSGWFHLTQKAGESTSGLTFWALRSSAKNFRYQGEPGRTLTLDQDQNIISPLIKWIPPMPTFMQSSLQKIPFPTNQWTHVRVHLRLSEGDDGLMQVWQDQQKIISQTGPTLPQADTVYSILELGVLENGGRNQSDLKVSIDNVSLGLSAPEDL